MRTWTVFLELVLATQTPPLLHAGSMLATHKPHDNDVLSHEAKPVYPVAGGIEILPGLV